MKGGEMDIDSIKTLLPGVRYACLAIILGGIAAIVYYRSRPRVITLNEITDWANENKSLGSEVFVSKISMMPLEVSNTVRKEMGLQRILQKYKDDTSVLVTLIDEKGNIVKSVPFLGTKLDEDLLLALGDKQGIKIKL